MLLESIMTSLKIPYLILAIFLPVIFQIPQQKGHSFAIYLTEENIDPWFTVGGAAGWKHAPLQAKPIITDSDIISYNPRRHKLKLSSKIEAFYPFIPSKWDMGFVGGRSFVIVVDGEKIYLGVFDTIFSSIKPFSVPCITFDQYAMDESLYPNELLIQPPDFSHARANIPRIDPRSDPRMIHAFTALRKIGSDK
jgi:hypothetical protein